MLQFIAGVYGRDATCKVLMTDTPEPSFFNERTEWALQNNNGQINVSSWRWYPQIQRQKNIRTRMPLLLQDKILNMDIWLTNIQIIEYSKET